LTKHNKNLIQSTYLAYGCIIPSLFDVVDAETDDSDGELGT